MKISFDSFKRQVLASGKDSFRLSDCSTCSRPVSYIVRGEGVFFDVRCECITSELGIRPRTRHTFFEHLNVIRPGETIRGADPYGKRMQEWGLSYDN